MFIWKARNIIPPQRYNSFLKMQTFLKKSILKNICISNFIDLSLRSKPKQMNLKTITETSLILGICGERVRQLIREGKLLQAQDAAPQGKAKAFIDIDDAANAETIAYYTATARAKRKITPKAAAVVEIAPDAAAAITDAAPEATAIQ